MELARYWWVFLIRGVLVLAFAGLALLMPAAAVFALVVLFAIYAGVSGMLAIGAAVFDGGEYPRWTLWLQGVAGMGSAVLALAWPGLTAVVLLYLIAWWALLSGVLELFAAVRLRRVMTGEWRLVLAGCASIGFAVLVFFAPGAGALALWALIVAYALVFGSAMIAVGLTARRHARMLA
jgi:uncharacterized membrane protein HdeD (DUF308 family)